MRLADIFRWSETCDALEGGKERTPGAETNTIGNGFDGHVGILSVIVNTLASLLDTVLINEIIEVLVIVFVDNLGHIFIFGVGELG